MSIQCQMCGKGKQMGNRVSHAKNRSKHVFKPNLQVKRVVGNGLKKKMLICTRCVKKVNKANKS